MRHTHFSLLIDKALPPSNAITYVEVYAFTEVSSLHFCGEN